MIIRPREYKTCSECGSNHLIHEEAVGCDSCAKVVDLARKHTGYHEVTVFFSDNTKTQYYMMCSILCTVKWLRAFKIPKNFQFISLPLLSGANTLRQFRKHLRR